MKKKKKNRAWVFIYLADIGTRSEYGIAKRQARKRDSSDKTTAQQVDFGWRIIILSI